MNCIGLMLDQRHNLRCNMNRLLFAQCTHLCRAQGTHTHSMPSLLKNDINTYPAKVNNLNFQPLEVVSRYRDPQLQVAENYSCLFNLSTKICKY